jgi:hypothetical protein
VARISIEEAQAWSEPTKGTLSDLDAALLIQVEDQVMSMLASSKYDISLWIDAASTPGLVRSIIAMDYVAWLYDRQYSEDSDEGNAWAKMLRATVLANINGILDGTFTLDGIPVVAEGQGTASFYPNDESSAACPTWGDTSTGPPKFSMGMRF